MLFVVVETVKKLVATSFVWIIIFLDGYFERGNRERWMKNLLKSSWDHTILYADKSIEDKQLLVIPPLREYKSMNMASGWKIKFTFYFMEITQEQFHLVKWSFLYVEISWKYLQVSSNHYFLWPSFWTWRHFEFMRLCWDKRWTTLCRILQFCTVSYICMVLTFILSRCFDY
jgi:hypothetical protein